MDGSVYIISVMTCGIVKKRIWRFSNVFVRKVVNMNVVILECRSVELNAVQPIIFEYSLRHHKFSSVILLKVTTSKNFLFLYFLFFSLSQSICHFCSEPWRVRMQGDLFFPMMYCSV